VIPLVSGGAGPGSFLFLSLYRGIRIQARGLSPVAATLCPQAYFRHMDAARRFLYLTILTPLATMTTKSSFS
jgi:hypothetical protein